MAFRFVNLVICLLILLSVQEIYAQKKFKFFMIPGRVKTDKGDPGGTVVNLLNLQSNIVEKTLSVGSGGKFDLELKYHTEYKISLMKEGYYTKDILISTVVPSSVWQKDSVFPPFYIVVNLFKKVPDTTLSFEGKTIGKISYSPKGGLDNFDSENYLNDKDIKDEIETALKDSRNGDFNEILATALELEKGNDLKSAYQKYLAANRIKPGDKFVNEKIKDLTIDLKNELEEAKLQEEFNHHMGLGIANVDKKSYQTAAQNFKDALKVKPGELTAVAKLKEAELLLADINAQKEKAEAEFNRLLALGDENVGNQLYPEAVSSYQGALKIKTGDAACMAKLASAEKLLAQANAEKAKLEESFKRLLVSGDKNSTDQNYAEAIIDYKGALSLKPEDAAARQKLSLAEGALAKLTAEKTKAEEERAKAEAEFNRLLASGDKNSTDQKYPEAIGDYKGALSLKPGDAGAKQKLSSVEGLLAKLTAEKAKAEEERAKTEAEFNRLLANGDKNSTDQKYPEAISDYKGALSIKPGDAGARQKLSSAEGLLAKLIAEKAKAEEERAKTEAEFNRLLANGDKNSSDQKYPEAISDYTGALSLKPGDAGARQKLSSAEGLLAKLTAEKAKAEEERAKAEAEFERLLASGDKNSSHQNYPEAISDYKSALSLKPEDASAKQKLSSLEGLLAKITAEKAKAEEERARADAEFNRLLALGDENVGRQLYEEAVSSYQGALKIKPGDPVTSGKLKVAMESLTKKNESSALSLSESQKKDNSFQLNIAKGDENYKRSQWANARFYYIEALNVKPEDQYSISRVESCDKMIDANISAEKMQEYDKLISKGNDAFKSTDYAAARFYYRSSLALLSWETYPQIKLREIDLILNERLTMQEKQTLSENMLKADEAFNKKEYSIARFYYNKANEISQGEYSLSRLKEIENIVNGHEEKRINTEYSSFIQKANEAIQQKNFSLARYYYQKAVTLKPNEAYAKEELKKLNYSN